MRKISAAVIGLVMLVAMLAACGSSGSSKSGAGNNTTPTTQASGSGSGSNDFSQLVAQASKAKIKITYQQDGNKTITIAQDGNGKSAYTSDNSTIYSDGSTTVTCDGTGADAKCTQLPVAGGLGSSILTVFTSLFSGLTKLDSSVYKGHVSYDTIAGRDARCITFKASDFAGFAALGSGDISDPSAEATICVDKETGFLLKLEEKSKGSSKDLFVATDVGEPTDADLTPPATPQTLPVP